CMTPLGRLTASIRRRTAGAADGPQHPNRRPGLRGAVRRPTVYPIRLRKRGSTRDRSDCSPLPPALPTRIVLLTCESPACRLVWRPAENTGGSSRSKEAITQAIRRMRSHRTPSGAPTHCVGEACVGKTHPRHVLYEDVANEQTRRLSGCARTCPGAR